MKPPLISDARNALVLDKVDAPAVELPQVAVVAAPVVNDSENISSTSQVESAPVNNTVTNTLPAIGSIPAIPPRPSKNYLLTDKEITEIGRRRDNLKVQVAELSKKLTALEQPISGDVGATLQRIASEKTSLNSQYDEANRDFDRSTRRLALWYGRQKRVIVSDPTNMASEVAVSSETVKKSKEAFERATWEYLSQAEKLPYSPGQ